MRNICVLISFLIINVVIANELDAITTNSFLEAKIKASFLSSTAANCDYDEMLVLQRKAIDLCGGDNKLISRIAIQIAEEYPDRISWAINMVAKYGSSEDVSFLEGFTNSYDYAAKSTGAIIHISGVSSNTINMVDHVMDLKLKDEHDKYLLCSALFHKTKHQSTRGDARMLVVESLKRYMIQVPSLGAWADEFVVLLDPQYENSDERMKLLEAISEKNPHEFHRQHATNAVKRIKAFREKKERK